MIHALSIAGDVAWIVGLALMASYTLAAWRRLDATAKVPVFWRSMTATVRAPRWLAMLAIPTIAFAIGIWLKIESRAVDLDMAGAFITLGVRVSLAPMFTFLQIGRVQKALAIMEGEGSLGPPR